MCCICELSYKPRDVQIYLLGNCFGLSSSCLWWPHHADVVASVLGAFNSFNVSLSYQMELNFRGNTIKRKVGPCISDKNTHELICCLLITF